MIYSSPIVGEGKPIGLRGIMADLTNVKLAEQALRKSEERYRDLFDSIGDFIYSHDLEGKFITVNRALTTTLSYAPKELTGKLISDLMLPDYRAAFKKEIPSGKDLPQEISEGTETILLVDDEDMIIGTGKEMLEEMRYTVLTATTGQGAIDAYREREGEIHMVILDMIMPEMGGGDTFDRLKGLDPEIKVLLSSGYSIDGQATEILERGCNGFIQKPFNMKEILDKIREILDKESGDSVADK